MTALPLTMAGKIMEMSPSSGESSGATMATIPMGSVMEKLK